ncbi:MAG: urea transporter [Bdellovibrionota bacterium]
MAEQLKFFFIALLKSYAQIFFSYNVVFGLCVLTVTFLVPSLGIYGILGACFTNIWAIVLGLNINGINAGLYGFNGVLLGLALGTRFELTFELILLLFIGGLLTTFIAEFIRHVFERSLQIPAMSLPFTLVTWLVLLASINIGKLTAITNLQPFLQINTGITHSIIGSFLSNLSAILFHPDPIAGAAIAVSLLIISPISLLLLIIGFVVGLFIHDCLGLDERLIETQFVGFNYMFSALAVGGIFTIPCPGSILLAAITAASTVIITCALDYILPSDLPVLAFPLNFTAMLVLLCLRLRMRSSLGILLPYYPAGSPENNLMRHKEALAYENGFRIALPFVGKWKVSQGIDGIYTHQGPWRFAYDFQAVDPFGKIFKATGLAVENYYSYNCPVLCPADGKVKAIENSIHDNEIGAVNLNKNWGNYVITEHAPGYFSCLAHLKTGSVRVAPGDIVLKGQMIGLCGNSGRSPYPHIHLQFQSGQYIGSSSIAFNFSEVLAENNKLLLNKQLNEGAIVENPSPTPHSNEFFPLHFETKWVCNFENKQEIWEPKIDLYGNLFLESFRVNSYKAQTKVHFSILDNSIRVLRVEGSKNSALYCLAKSFARIPFIDCDKSVTWGEIHESNNFFSYPISKFIDLLSVFGIAINRIITHTATSNTSRVTLLTSATSSLKIPLVKLPFRKENKAVIILIKNIGLLFKQGRIKFSVLFQPKSKFGH